MQYVFVNRRALKGGGSAVLYRNEKPNAQRSDRFVVTVFGGGEGKITGVDHPFKFRSLAVAWRETIRN